MKRCCTCKAEKPLEDFHRNRNSPDGRYAACKACKAKRHIDLYANNPAFKARKAEYLRGYYLKNAEKIKKQSANYLLNTEKGRAVARRSYKAWEQSEAGKAYRRKRRLENPEHWRAHIAVRDAMRRGDLVRPSQCSRCAKKCKPHGHHHRGYAAEHRLDVEWLCVKCHNAV